MTLLIAEAHGCGCASRRGVGVVLPEGGPEVGCLAGDPGEAGQDDVDDGEDGREARHQVVDHLGRRLVRL